MRMEHEIIVVMKFNSFNLQIFGRIKLILGELILLLEVIESTVDNLNCAPGLGIVGVRWHISEGLNDVVSLDDLAENDVLSVEPTGLGKENKELGAVGVLAVVGHGYPAGATVGQDEVLIVKALSVDALASCAISYCDVSHLQHEVRHDPVDG